MLDELNKTSQGSSQRQLHTLLYRMISRDEVNKPDIIVRVTAIVEGKYFRTVMSCRCVIKFRRK